MIATLGGMTGDLAGMMVELVEPVTLAAITMLTPNTYILNTASFKFPL
jgi:cobalamin synthase